MFTYLTIGLLISGLGAYFYAGGRINQPKPKPSTIAFVFGVGVLFWPVILVFLVVEFEKARRYVREEEGL